MTYAGPRWITACVLLLLALWMPAMAWGQEYRIVDMGVGEPYFPTALNNRGQVLLTNNRLTPARIGLFLASGANLLPRWAGPASLLWDNGGTSAIGLLPGGTYSRGCGLNDAGQVVGFGDKMTPYSTCLDQPSMALHAFLWQGGGLADLDPGVEVELEDGTKCRAFIIPSLGLGINNQGQVTGWMGSRLPSGDYNHGSLHAFRTAGGQIDHEADDLTPGTQAITQGWFINNAGTVLGTQFGGSYVFFGGGGLPPAGGIVYAMNDSGATVGVAGGHAFVSGAAAALPDSFEAALGINNHGQIVGQGTIGDRQHALLYSDGQVIDLEGTLPAGSGWELAQAALINDQGQIVVWGSHNGQSTLGLLTPEAITLTLAFQPDHVCKGDTASGLIRLSPAAPAGGLLVQLKSNPPLPELPLGVTVPPGQTEKTFSVLVPGEPGTAYQVTASIPSGSGLASAEATLTVARPQVQSLSFSAAEISSDDVATGTVTLSCPAPAGGMTVTLEAHDARQYDQLSVPDTVEVPEGKIQAEFSIASKPNEIWQYDVIYTIKATAGGATQSQDLMVHPTIHNLYLAVDPVLGTTGGLPVTGTITLSLPAPAGGRAVAVSSSTPAVASAAGGSLVVPAGQQTLDFTIQTAKVTSPAAVEITAQTPTSEETRRFSVHP